MENLNWGRASFNWHIPVIALTVAVNSQKAGNIAGWSKAGEKQLKLIWMRDIKNTHYENDAID